MGFAVAEDQEFTLPPLEERPLVTFALFAYNQEKYIREAVEGAFAQTYEPLEIILSDDCSTDRTFEIMEEMASCYKGQHRIKLNRNSKNLETGAHVNKIDAMANGVLIVHAAGDDISLPDRTTALFSAWKTAGYPSAVWSNALLIDEHGNRLGPSYISPQHPSTLLQGQENISEALGATIAIDRRLIDTFGPFDPLIFREDSVISYRATILNGLQYLSSPLVFYRKHNSLSNNQAKNRKEFLNFHSRWALCRIQLQNQKKLDSEKVQAPRFINPQESRLLIYDNAVLKITNSSIFSASLSILRHLFLNIKETRDLAWLLLIRLGIKDYP